MLEDLYVLCHHATAVLIFPPSHYPRFVVSMYLRAEDIYVLFLCVTFSRIKKPFEKMIFFRINWVYAKDDMEEYIFFYFSHLSLY